MSTGGGVTFGGGEPLLYAGFLKDFRQICGEEWHLCVETSLYAPWENVKIAAECMDIFYIDCKDVNPEIYRRYTGKSNERVLDNLKKLLEIIPPDRIIVRLPLIPEFNTKEDQERSRQALEKMGIERFDLFTYKCGR